MQPDEPSQPMTEAQAEMYVWLKGMIYKQALQIVSNGKHFVLITVNSSDDGDSFTPELISSLPMEGSKMLVEMALEHCYGEDAIVVHHD
jgi:hypothetical protein